MVYIVKGYGSRGQKKKFRTKAEATRFANSMRRARRVEGIKGRTRITVSKSLF